MHCAVALARRADSNSIRFLISEIGPISDFQSLGDSWTEPHLKMPQKVITSASTYFSDEDISQGEVTVNDERISWCTMDEDHHSNISGKFILISGSNDPLYRLPPYVFLHVKKICSGACR